MVSSEVMTCSIVNSSYISHAYRWIYIAKAASKIHSHHRNSYAGTHPKNPRFFRIYSTARKILVVIPERFPNPRVSAYNPPKNAEIPR
jgi:hypothetical protein